MAVAVRTYRRGKVRPRSATHRASTEGGLQGVAVGDAEHPDDDPSGAFLVFLHLEFAVLEGKLVGNGRN